MQAFEHARPRTVERAVELLAEAKGGGHVLAGGTDLLALMKDGVLTPRRVVSLQAVEALRGITHEAEKGLRIGALVTLQELLDDERVGSEYPALAEAAAGVSSPQVRAMGTVGGDLCQWPRCWWFREGFGLLARQGGTSLVEAGDNRYHAILGNAGPAQFVSASSLAPPLVALGARATVAGPEGVRELAVSQLFTTPRTDAERPVRLGEAEVLTEIRVPPPAGRASATYEVRQRQALDWPLVTASVSFLTSEGRAGGARVVLGHVAPIPWAAETAERVLEGQLVDTALAARAGAAAVEGARPLSRNAYKVQLARVAVQRAVLRAAGKSRIPIDGTMKR